MCVLVTMQSTDTTMPSDGVRSCQMLSDEKTSDVRDQIQCQMASDTSTLSHYISQLWRPLNAISLLTNLAWLVLQTRTDACLKIYGVLAMVSIKTKIKEWWMVDPPLWQDGLNREEFWEKRNCGKACGVRERERESCWPLVIVEWLRPTLTNSTLTTTESSIHVFVKTTNR